MNLPQKLMCMLLILTFSMTGCRKENPGTWPAEKIEAQLIERFNLSEVSLEKKEGGFEGSGTAEDGETYTFDIKQFPSESKYTWDAKGDRGTFEDGFYELK